MRIKKSIFLLVILMILTSCSNIELNEDFSSQKFAVDFKYNSPSCSVAETEEGIKIVSRDDFELYITSFFVATLENDIMVQLGDELLEEFPDAANVKTKDGVYFEIPGFLLSFDVSENEQDGNVNLYYVTDGNVSFSVFDRSYPSDNKADELKNSILNSITLKPEALMIPEDINSLPKIRPEIIPQK